MAGPIPRCCNTDAVKIEKRWLCALCGNFVRPPRPLHVKAQRVTKGPLEYRGSVVDHVWLGANGLPVLEFDDGRVLYGTHDKGEAEDFEMEQTFVVRELDECQALEGFPQMEDMELEYLDGGEDE